MELKISNIFVFAITQLFNLKYAGGAMNQQFKNEDYLIYIPGNNVGQAKTPILVYDEHTNPNDLQHLARIAGIEGFEFIPGTSLLNPLRGVDRLSQIHFPHVSYIGNTAIYGSDDRIGKADEDNARIMYTRVKRSADNFVLFKKLLGTPHEKHLPPSNDYVVMRSMQREKKKKVTAKPEKPINIKKILIKLDDRADTSEIMSDIKQAKQEMSKLLTLIDEAAKTVEKIQETNKSKLAMKLLKKKKRDNERKKLRRIKEYVDAQFYSLPRSQRSLNKIAIVDPKTGETFLSSRNNLFPNKIQSVKQPALLPFINHNIEASQKVLQTKPEKQASPEIPLKLYKISEADRDYFFQVFKKGFEAEHEKFKAWRPRSGKKRKGIQIRSKVPKMETSIKIIETEYPKNSEFKKIPVEKQELAEKQKHSYTDSKPKGSLKRNSQINEIKNNKYKIYSEGKQNKLYKGQPLKTVEFLSDGIKYWSEFQLNLKKFKDNFETEDVILPEENDRLLRSIAEPPPSFSAVLFEQGVKGDFVIYPKSHNAITLEELYYKRFFEELTKKAKLGIVKQEQVLSKRKEHKGIQKRQASFSEEKSAFNSEEHSFLNKVSKEKSTENKFVVRDSFENSKHKIFASISEEVTNDSEKRTDGGNSLEQNQSQSANKLDQIKSYENKSGKLSGEANFYSGSLERKKNDNSKEEKIIEESHVVSDNYKSETVAFKKGEKDTKKDETDSATKEINFSNIKSTSEMITKESDSTEEVKSGTKQVPATATKNSDSESEDSKDEKNNRVNTLLSKRGSANEILHNNEGTEDTKSKRSGTHESDETTECSFENESKSKQIRLRYLGNKSIDMNKKKHIHKHIDYDKGMVYAGLKLKTESTSTTEKPNNDEEYFKNQEGFFVQNFHWLLPITGDHINLHDPPEELFSHEMHPHYRPPYSHRNSKAVVADLIGDLNA